MKFLPFFAALLRDNAARAALSFCSIAAVFTLYAYLGAVERAFDGEVSLTGRERLIVRNKASIILPLPRFYELRIEEIDGVVDATAATWFGGLYRDRRNAFTQLAVEPRAFLEAHPGLLLAESALRIWERTPRGAVVGRGLAERLGWQPGDTVPLRSALWPRRNGSATWTFRIVGIYDAGEAGLNDGQFLFRHDFLDANREERHASEVGWYVVRVTAAGAAPRIAAAIDRRFAHARDETHSETESAFVENLVKQIGDVGLILRLLLTVVFGTAGLIAMTALAREVRERRFELALLKTLGFGDFQLLGLAGAALCLFCLGAATFGLHAGSFLIAQGDPTGGALPSFSIAPTVWTKALAWALGLAAVSMIGSAIGLLRIAPAAILRDDLR